MASGTEALDAISLLLTEKLEWYTAIADHTISKVSSVSCINETLFACTNVLLRHDDF
jgi:hypothetical protein